MQRGPAHKKLKVFCEQINTGNKLKCKEITRGTILKGGKALNRHLFGGERF